MTPDKLNQKWWARFRKLEEQAHDNAQWTAESATEHKIISEFLTDIEYIHIEETEQEKENRALIAKVADKIRKDKVKITL